MACPRCGDICHCHAGVRTPNAAQLRPRFEVDTEKSGPGSAVLVDPEQYEATEEQFSVSLERPTDVAPRFVPNEPSWGAEEKATPAAQVCAETNASLEGENSGEQLPTTAGATQEAESAPALDAQDRVTSSETGGDGEPFQAHSPSHPDAWKEELAARLSSYRAKRKPRPPKYPSLSLDFEPAFASTSGTRTPDVRTALAIDDREQKISSDAPVHRARAVPEEDGPPSSATPAASGRVIEFPRFFGPEEGAPDQLAEPVCEQPRILDAPEIELPAPALGGIVLEPNEAPETEERPGFEVPLRSASISRRVFAATVDVTVSLSGGVVFAYIFLHLVKVLPTVPHLLPSAALVMGVLWAGYQYLLLTYSGTTPGLRLAKLQLTDFDGSPVRRSRRRWRVMASLLSAVSLGLGFAWCFLDEDALCWHDRITRTHLLPRD